MSTSFGGVIKLALVPVAVMLRMFLGAAAAHAQEALAARDDQASPESRTNLRFG